MMTDLEKIEKIISEPNSFNNRELMECMDVLANEHEKVKETLIKLTYQIDKLENSYNKILEEYKKRK